MTMTTLPSGAVKSIAFRPSSMPANRDVASLNVGNDSTLNGASAGVVALPVTMRRSTIHLKSSLPLGMVRTSGLPFDRMAAEAAQFHVSHAVTIHS